MWRSITVRPIEHIRINVVSPGPTATPIWSSLGLPDETLSEVAGRVSQRLLPGRFLEPAAIADAILFLLSNAARHLWPGPGRRQWIHVAVGGSAVRASLAIIRRIGENRRQSRFHTSIETGAIHVE